MIDIKTYTTPCKSRSGNYSEGTTVVQGSTTVVGGGSSVDIVKELDTTTLTDANVLSSKRVLKEISDRGHTHSNKAVLDNLTQAVIDNSHTHANKATLDVIDQSLSTASAVKFAKVTANDAELGTIKATTGDFSGAVKAAAATVIGLITCATLNADAATIPTIAATNINASTQVVSPLFVGHLQGNADTATRLRDTFKLWGQDFYGNNIPTTASIVTPAISNDNYFIGSAREGLGTNFNGALIYSYSGYPIYFFAGGISRMYISSVGNVGIGTTSPAYKLDVNGTMRVADTAIFDGNIGTSTYISQSQGWMVTPQGNADFRTIYTDELHATAFTADVSQALAGSDYLTKSVSKLSANFVVPAVGSSVRIIVDDLEGFPATQCFENGDYIRFRAFNKTSGLTISDVWGTVTLDTSFGTSGFSNGTQAYIYTVTSAAVTGLTVYKGSEVLDYGKSSDGLIVRTTLDKNNSPYSQIATWVNDPSNSANYTVHARLGKLSGIAHCSGYGLYTDNAYLTNSIVVGDLTKTNNYLSYNPAEGLVVKGNLYMSSGESVSGRLSDLQLTADGVKSTVSTYVGATGENIISTINQQAGSVQIQASKINLTGAVTFSSLDSSTQGVINAKADTSTVNQQVSNAITTAATDATNKINAYKNQNGTQLLPNDWTIGTGETDFYTQNGLTSENSRIIGQNHKGENVILWQCSPSGDGQADGGWNTRAVAIDNTKTYRFSVFVKKMNPHGYFDLGCSNDVCDLNTSNNYDNPYFCVSPLSDNLASWLLVTGYVFPAGATGLTNIGEVWDCTTGKRVTSGLTCYNWRSTTTATCHRCYLYYDDETSNRQYMWNPRVDLVDGNEPSIAQLLGMSAINAYTDTAQQAAQTYATSNCVQVGLSNAPDAIKNQVLAAAHGNFSYIDGSSIYTGTLNANQVTAGYISADRIAASSITADKINVTDLTANSAFISNLKTNIVNAAYVNTLTLDAAAIKAGTIDTARMNASDIVTKGLQAKTIDAMNATIQNITVTNATISGTLNGCTGIFSGNLSGVKGTIGGWTIQDGGLYNSVSGTGFIKLEVNGGRQLSINSSADSPVLAIRSDSKPALSIYTQDSGGTGIEVTAQTYSWAIKTYGKVQFISRIGERTYINMLCKCQVTAFNSGTIGSGSLAWYDAETRNHYMPNRVICRNTSEITLYLPDTSDIYDGYEIEIRKVLPYNITIKANGSSQTLLLAGHWGNDFATSRTLDGGNCATYTYYASGNIWIEKFV